MIRVIAGRLRGRKLSVPPGIRPTKDRARQAIFDVLGNSVQDTTVLDAAAGSGAYGIEALSRGARNAVFVEASARVVRVLEENLARLGLGEISTVARCSVASYAIRSRGTARLDLIFHDPPWEEGPAEDLPRLFELLGPGGILVHERGDDSDAWPGGPETADERRYGETRYLLYRR